jgi:hypothetical protein
MGGGGQVDDVSKEDLSAFSLANSLSSSTLAGTTVALHGMRCDNSIGLLSDGISPSLFVANLEYGEEDFNTPLTQVQLPLNPHFRKSRLNNCGIFDQNSIQYNHCSLSLLLLSDLQLP